MINHMGKPSRKRADCPRYIPPIDIIRSMRHFRPSTEIQQAWQYNNMHYVALAEMVPVLTGIPFDEYVMQHIVKPLGMSETLYNATQARLEGNLTDSWVREGINRTECALSKSSNGSPSKSCLGETKSMGWWLNGDNLYNAGPGGVMTSGTDMVRLPADCYNRKY